MIKEGNQSLTSEERQTFHANCGKKAREWNQVVFLVSAFALPGAGYLLHNHPSELLRDHHIRKTQNGIPADTRRFLGLGYGGSTCK